MTCWHRSRNVLTHGLFFKRVAIIALHMARDMFASLPPRSGRWFQLMPPHPRPKKPLSNHPQRVFIAQCNLRIPFPLLEIHYRARTVFEGTRCDVIAIKRSRFAGGRGRTPVTYLPTM